MTGTAGSDLEEFAARSGALYVHVVRVVQAVTGDGQLAEDAAQEALVRLWERRRVGLELDDERSWAVKVALNWSRSRFRRRKAESRAVARLAAREAVGRPDVGATTLSADVRDLLLALPRRQREVAVLHYIADFDVASVALITGTSIGAVKNALFHARASLAAGIDPADHDRGPDGRSLVTGAGPRRKDRG